MNTTNNQAPLLKPKAYPAHLGWRLLSLLYDSLPLIPLLLLTSGIFLALRGGQTVEHSPLAATLEWFVVWLVIGIYAVLSWRYGGQTMGMRPWRLRVVASDGRIASFKSLCLRYLTASATPGLCLLWAMIDSERRGLHDLASGTLFVRIEKS